MIVKEIRLIKLIFVMLIFGACESSKNTTIIETDAVFPGKEVPLEEISKESNIQTIHIGELERIKSLDPLFARNNAERRLIQLIFEGLTQLDKNGLVQPALAKEWSISNDSLQYTFQLSKKRFHNSNIFFNGVGRFVTSQDVLNAFLRMASKEVPPQNAELFWAIRGFDIYFAEQHELFDPSLRSLKTILGISIPNDSTITFNLDYKDSDFLKKLAHPSAVIYPSELADRKDESFLESPIGTDNWILDSNVGDSVFTLIEQNANNNLLSNDKSKRLIVQSFSNELTLSKSFFKDEIQIIPELGPEISKTMIKSNGQLSESYTDKYELNTTKNIRKLYVYLNTENVLKIKETEINRLILNQSILSKLEDTGIFTNSKSFMNITSDSEQTININPKVVIAFEEDLLARKFVEILYLNLKDQTNLTLVKSFVSGRETVLSVVGTPKLNAQNQKLILTLSANHNSIRSTTTDILEVSSEPWWIESNYK